MKLQLLTEHGRTVSTTGHGGLISTRIMHADTQVPAKKMQERAVMRGSEGS